MIYLDHNATTPLDEDVKKTMAEAFPLFGNPSSSHRLGRAAKSLVDHARQQVAQAIGCEASEVIFTSGGTESNNLAIIGTAFRRERGHIITSVIEHPSVMNPVKWLNGREFSVTFLPVDPTGCVDPSDVAKAIRSDTILITIMHSNNETGVLQPIQEIGRIAREHRVVFHTDAAQSVGKVGVSCEDLMVDMLTIVSHKLYGPKGVGALYIRDLTVSPLPILFGAGHERGLRPGTENVVSIAGLGKACEVAAKDLSFRYAHTREMRDAFHDVLKRELDIRVNGHEGLRLPNTLNVSIRGIIGEDLVTALQDEVAFSSGSACHAGLRKPSPVLMAMGTPEEDALSAVRVSTGKDTTRDEILTAASRIVQSSRRLLKLL